MAPSRKRKSYEKAYLVNRIRGGRYMGASSKADYFIVEWHKKGGIPYPENQNRKWYARCDFVSEEADSIIEKELNLGVVLTDSWDLLEDDKVPNGDAIKFDKIVREKIRPIDNSLADCDDFEVYICNEVALVAHITYGERGALVRTDFHYVCFNSLNSIHPVQPEEQFETKTELELWDLLEEWEHSQKSIVSHEIDEVEVNDSQQQLSNGTRPSVQSSDEDSGRGSSTSNSTSVFISPPPALHSGSGSTLSNRFEPPSSSISIFISPPPALHSGPGSTSSNRFEPPLSSISVLTPPPSPEDEASGRVEEPTKRQCA